MMIAWLSRRCKEAFAKESTDAEADNAAIFQEIEEAMEAFTTPQSEDLEVLQHSRISVSPAPKTEEASAKVPTAEVATSAPVVQEIEETVEAFHTPPSVEIEAQQHSRISASESPETVVADADTEAEIRRVMEAFKRNDVDAMHQMLDKMANNGVKAKERSHENEYEWESLTSCSTGRPEPRKRLDLTRSTENAGLSSKKIGTRDITPSVCAPSGHMPISSSSDSKVLEFSRYCKELTTPKYLDKGPLQWKMAYIEDDQAENSPLMVPIA